MKNKHESKIKYEAKGNPYLVISQKDEFSQIHHFYKLDNLDQLYDIPTDKLKNGDTAIVKKNGKFNKFMWVVDDDWNYENWVFTGNLNEEQKESEKKDMTESTTIENKATEKVVPFHEMTCEQMKKQYPNLNMLYEHCWVKELHFILDYCDIKFTSKSETNREATIVINFKSNLVNSNESVTISANIWGNYDREVGRKVYYTDIFVEEIHGNCTLAMLRLIDATCDTLEKMLKNLNLDNTYGGDYARIYHIFDSFKLYQNSECSDGDCCNCDDEGM